MAPRVPDEIDVFTAPHSRMKELVNIYTQKVRHARGSLGSVWTGVGRAPPRRAMPASRPAAWCVQGTTQWVGLVSHLSVSPIYQEVTLPSYPTGVFTGIVIIRVVCLPSIDLSFDVPVCSSLLSEQFCYYGKPVGASSIAPTAIITLPWYHIYTDVYSSFTGASNILCFFW